MNKQFILCSDKKTIEDLKKSGYQVVDENDRMTTFLNDMSKPHTFSEKKVIYSNTLTMICQ